MSLSLSLAAVPLLIGTNAFFVAAEYAVVAAKPVQIESLRKRGRTGAADALATLTAHPANAIGAIQVCITMTNLMLGWIGEPAMSAVLHRLFGPLIEIAPNVFTGVATALSFLVVTLLTVVFSELLPKALTLRYVEPIAVLTAKPILLIQRFVRPLVILMNAMANSVTRPLGLGRVDDAESQEVSVDELRLLATRAGESGSLSPRERTLILNTLTIGRRRAQDIMVPRVRTTYLDIRRSMEENLAIAGRSLFSRLPLCESSMDKVLGVVYTKELLTAHQAGGASSVLQLIARPAVFAPENISLDVLLGVMHEKKSRLVFLVDEYGGVEGIVTLQDVINELMGESRVRE